MGSQGQAVLCLFQFHQASSLGFHLLLTTYGGGRAGRWKE